MLFRSPSLGRFIMFWKKIILASLFSVTFSASLLAIPNIASASHLAFHTGGKVVVNPTPYFIFYGDWNSYNGAGKSGPAKSIYTLFSDYQSSNRWSHLINSYFGLDLNNSKYFPGNINLLPQESNTAFVNYDQLDGLGETSTYGNNLPSASLGIDEIVSYSLSHIFRLSDTSTTGSNKIGRAHV